MVWKPEATEEYDCLMTLNDRRSCPFVVQASGLVKYGQKDEVKLIIVNHYRNIYVSAQALRAAMALLFPQALIPFARSERTCLASWLLAPVSVRVIGLVLRRMIPRISRYEI